MPSDPFRRDLAEAAHDGWSGWMKFLFAQTHEVGGTMAHPPDTAINAEKVKRWRRQMNTEFKELPPGEQASDYTEADRYIAVIRKHLQPLLSAIGDKGQCKGCGAVVYWVVHKNGKKSPYTVNGTNHFIDCPQAGRFKR
jgi:hypothetical protein